MILRKVADGRFVSPDHFTGVDKWASVAAGFAQFRFRGGRGIREQRVQKRGLPGTVASHERDLFAAADACGEIADDTVVVVRLPEMFDLQNVFARRPLLLELDKGPLDV